MNEIEELVASLEKDFTSKGEPTVSITLEAVVKCEKNIVHFLSSALFETFKNKQPIAPILASVLVVLFEILYARPELIESLDKLAMPKLKDKRLVIDNSEIAKQLIDFARANGKNL
jgi:TctA family transporter